MIKTLQEGFVIRTLQEGFVIRTLQEEFVIKTLQEEIVRRLVHHLYTPCRCYNISALEQGRKLKLSCFVQPILLQTPLKGPKPSQKIEIRPGTKE